MFRVHCLSGLTVITSNVESVVNAMGFDTQKNTIHLVNVEDSPNEFFAFLQPKYVLDWIDVDRLNFERVSSCPEAIHFLKAYPERVVISGLVGNPCKEAMRLLVELVTSDTLLNPSDSFQFSANPYAIEWFDTHELWLNVSGLVTQYDNRVLPYITRRIPSMCDRDWSALSDKPYAIELLSSNIDKVNISNLCSNPNAEALIRARMPEWMTRLDFKKLCLNESFGSLLMDIFEDRVHIDDICFNVMCSYIVANESIDPDYLLGLYKKLEMHQQLMWQCMVPLNKKNYVYLVKKIPHLFNVNTVPSNVLTDPHIIKRVKASWHDLSTSDLMKNMFCEEWQPLIDECVVWDISNSEHKYCIRNMNFIPYYTEVLLDQFPELIQLESLCMNTHPQAMRYLEEYPEKQYLYYHALSVNPAIYIDYSCD